MLNGCVLAVNKLFVNLGYMGTSHSGLGIKVRLFKVGGFLNTTSTHPDHRMCTGSFSALGLLFKTYTRFPHSLLLKLFKYKK